MKKIRINELARELEVKPGVILDMLPDLGVQEKKTHSSSVDEDVALELRRRLVADGSIRVAEERSNGNVYDNDGESYQEPESEPVVQTPSAERPAESSERPTAATASSQPAEIQKAMPLPPAPLSIEVEQEAPAALAATAESERPAPTFRPLRPPL